MMLSFLYWHLVMWPVVPYWGFLLLSVLQIVDSQPSWILLSVLGELCSTTWIATSDVIWGLLRLYTQCLVFRLFLVCWSVILASCNEIVYLIVCPLFCLAVDVLSWLDFCVILIAVLHEVFVLHCLLGWEWALLCLLIAFPWCSACFCGLMAKTWSGRMARESPRVRTLLTKYVAWELLWHCGGTLLGFRHQGPVLRPMFRM